jgi:endonuclease/exonuclease/phosphatase family metal-dependent hydrolase
MPGFLEATVDVRGTRIRVFNTHLDYRPDPAVRRQQVTETLAIIGDASAPTLLFGDMNAPPSAPELQPLFERLRDSWTVSANAGFTYPAAAPVRRIDYVLASTHFRVRTASVPDSQASDHRPVIVDLVVDHVRN